MERCNSKSCGVVRLEIAGMTAHDFMDGEGVGGDAVLKSVQ